MIVPYIRSSSWSNYDYCQQQYFMTYILGYERKSSVKADKGTATHKVLEILAVIKKHYQDNKSEKITITDDALGQLTFNYSDFFKETVLETKEVEEINKGRVNKEIYKHKCKILYNHKRYGVEPITRLIKLASDYYAQRTNDWKRADFRDVGNFTWMALDYNNGQFNPMNMNILAPEKNFDIVIDRDWANVEYESNGKKIKGKLAIKGTIDLLTNLDNNIIEIVDWKGLPIDTKIPTPDGFKNMGELKVGDTVFDQFGKQCTVVGKSRVKTKDCYRITFDDGISVVCDDEHLWKLSNGDVVPVTELKKYDEININKPIECDNDKNHEAVNNLLSNKKLRKYCIRNSRENREFIFKTLMNVYDGKFENNRWFFKTEDEELAENFCHLLRTLGYSSILNQTIKDFIAKTTYRCISFGNEKTRKIVSIDKTISQKTQCISVDSPDNTYLCTEYYIPTHNTGQRKNWANGEIKTFEKLCNDTQLMLYYYAASHLYPWATDVFLTIFFVRDGGPFSIPFNIDHLDIFEKKLKEKFLEIKKNKMPSMVDPTQKDFRCKICDFSKGENDCKKISQDLYNIGYDEVINKYKNNKFDPNKYQSPGE